MKRKIYLTLIIALASIAGSLFAAAPPIKDWQKCIGGSQQDIPGAILRSEDGNIILLSNVDSHNGDVANNHGSTDIWITKLDSTGTILWQKSIGGTSIDVGTGISELENGNLIISGYSSSSNGDIPYNKGNFDVLLICTDSHGTILWTRIYGGSQVDLCYTQIRTSDGGFVLGGGSYSNDGDVSGNNGDQDFWVMKTDSLGNLLWQKSSGGSDIDVCYGLAEDAYGNIFACGTTNSISNVSGTHGNYDVWVIKYDASGNILWNKTYGGSNYETAQTILIDSHQKIFIGGYTRSNDGDVAINYGLSDSWIIQIDASGNLLNEKNIGGSGGENLYSIIETADGGYLLTSGTTSNDKDIKNSLGQEDIWLYKTDASLNVEWSENYGGSANDRPVCVIQNPDGGFLVAGYTFSNNDDVSGQHGSADIWLLNLSCKVPSAFFSTPSAACLGDTISVIDASSYATQSNWLLNGSLFSTANSAQIHFTASGVYHLSLSVQTCYYTSVYNNNIMVTDCRLPQVNFSTQTSTVCANSQVSFADASANANSWQWDFPGGTPSSSNLENPVVTYNQPGVFSVMLTVSNSFGNQTWMRLNYITVHAPPPIPVISVNGNEFTSSPAYQYQWFYNNAPIPSEVGQSYSAFLDGYYSVQVQSANQCTSQSGSVYYSMTGISEDISNDELSVFPNPSSDEINVLVPLNANGSLRIINTSGQILLEKNIVKNVQSQVIDLSQYPSGIYGLVFINDKGISIQKSIIKY